MTVKHSLFACRAAVHGPASSGLPSDSAARTGTAPRTAARATAGVHRQGVHHGHTCWTLLYQCQSGSIRHSSAKSMS